MRVLAPVIAGALLAATLSTAAGAQVARLATLDHDGLAREHYVFVPESETPPPLVIALHGMGGNAAKLRFGIGLTKRAARDGFAVVYPQGLRLGGGSRHWNAGFDFTDVDDVAYLSALIDHLAAEASVDGTRVAIMGISMGGYMAYHMACHAPVPLRAIASIAGTMGGADWTDCPATRGRAALLHIHGTEDGIIPIDGFPYPSGGWGGAPRAAEVVEHWAQRLGATPAATDNPHPKARERLWRVGENGAEARFIALPGVGHEWPSQATRGYPAVDVVAAFFQRHFRRSRPGTD